MRTIDRARIGLAVAALAAIAGCGSSTSAPAPSKAAAEAPKQDAPFNVGSIFPAGAGRDLVLATCGACHPVVCSARGQRTAERWDAVRKSHQDKLTSQTDANVTTMFAYLKQNFNDAKPEPAIPASLAEQGCTPF